MLVGDAMAKPLLKAFDEAAERGEPYDLSSLKMIISSGVMWTTEVKDQLLDRIPQLMLIDAIGSTEGSIGNQVTMRGVATETARFASNPTTKVVTEDGREVVPGSDEIGMIAAGGFVPIGYFKDPEKSARTFRVIDGVRYSFAGDFAKVAADGSLILLGRGNQVINSGGEKVFPEEVEEAVKRVDGVADCLVVGVDDERYGQAVTAVVALTPTPTSTRRRSSPASRPSWPASRRRDASCSCPRSHAPPTARPTTRPRCSTPTTPPVCRDASGLSQQARQDLTSRSIARLASVMMRSVSVASSACTAPATQCRRCSSSRFTATLWSAFVAAETCVRTSMQ